MKHKLTRLVANGLPLEKAQALLARRERRMKTGVRFNKNLRTGCWLLPADER